MLSRFLMLFSVLVLVSACSTKGKDTISDENITISERQPISNGPLSDIYDDPIGTQSLSGNRGFSQEDFVVNVGDRVFFGYDRYDLTAEARATLENQAQWMKQNGSSVTIEGHADERGTREYNLALGERRASSVKNYLMALGVSSSQINVVSYGKERPAVPGSNSSAWSQNRRSVSKIN